ncbi:hypothetical protein CVT24_008424 [Panaeolus cyanescens]|uniref:Uncharacterized protein n=1 Tax=Panaeolus cyanescens TaxID=181874 RepID=A0A409VDU0_9AGAR|nr:hypothetical protein CVT24_008424 [Panaeolus cyanescens]
MPPLPLRNLVWATGPTTQRLCLPLEGLEHVCITVPTVEGVKLALVRLHREILVQHPYISAACLLFVAFFPASPFYLIYYTLYAIPREIILAFLACLGFERRGVRAGSAAAWYQSHYHGPYTPSNGFFAHSQSYGAVARARPYRVDSDQDEDGSILLKWFWRLVGWSCAYAAIVILLKYGGSS